MNLQNALLVGLGGFLGANARYAVSVGLPRLLPTSFGGHWATFTVNLTGSFLLATLIAWSGRQTPIPQALKIMLGTGFFGAYTTYSTFANETVALGAGGKLDAAVAYFIATNGLSLLAVLGGLWIGGRI